MKRAVLTPRELAERWGVKAETIRARIEAGLIPAVDVSSPQSTRRRWRVSIETVERLERGEPSPPPAPPARAKRTRRRARQHVFYGPS